MSGYSKINFVKTHKSRSIDFSDLFPFSKNHKNPILEPTSEITKTNPNTKNCNTHFSYIENEHEDDGNGEKFNASLSRKGSVSYASSHIFKQSNSTLQSTVKRAFSMRRSSSVSERYCRIHDHSLTLLESTIDDEEDDGGVDQRMQTRSAKKKHKRNKILKACKKLFGL